MSFDALAPHYRWMEWLLAGGKLQRCRTAFLSELQRARQVLLLGEGNGRFLAAFTRVNRLARITVVDASAPMLQQAERRASTVLPATPLSLDFIQADLLTWSPPARSFDLIVSNFFFDCFRPDQLDSLIPRLAAAAAPDAFWLVCDFCLPARGLPRWRARAIVAAMYFFFRVATRLPARSLTPVDQWLQKNGFQLRERRPSEWGLLQADLWQRLPGSAGIPAGE